MSADEAAIEQACRVLSVQPGSSLLTLKRAYYKLALKTHPDKPGGSDDKYREVQEAYQLLCDNPLADFYRTQDENDAAAREEMAAGEAELAQLERQRREREKREQHFKDRTALDADRRQQERRRERLLRPEDAFFKYAHRSAPAVLFENEYYIDKRRDGVLWQREDGNASICWSVTYQGWLLQRAEQPYWLYVLPCSPQPFNSQGHKYVWATWWLCERLHGEPLARHRLIRRYLDSRAQICRNAGPDRWGY